MIFSPNIIPVIIGKRKDKPKKAIKVPVKLNIRLKRINFNRKISPLLAIYL